MTKNDIIQMARKSGILETMGYGNPHMKAWQADVVRELSHFATLVAATEREACAMALEGISNAPDMQKYAATIRARSKP